jgi:hypothetical protein
MDKIDIEIQRLTSLRLYLKIEINSNYGISSQSQKHTQSLFNRRNEVTMELKKLNKIKQRRIKLDKIIQRNEESMEM